jgi:choline dehydrogenase-like flavoprotein
VSTPEATPRPATYDADFIIVGSGAGGGTLAARLAEAGFQVLLLEAGGDPRSSIGDTPQTPQINSLPDDYDVPAFHAQATENSGLRWDFWVRHYADDIQQAKDPAYRAEHDGQPVNGVLYPRAATLGGCTAHNAMILVAPHNADWNQLADLTGDPTWRAEKMRPYFERLETEVAPLDPVVKDRNMRKVLLESAKAALRHPDIAITDADRRARLDGALDPNDPGVVAEDAIGLRYTPLTTRKHQRIGSRERVRDVAKAHPDRLRYRLNALATRVLFDDSGRAIGVEYLDGEFLYGAHPRPSRKPAKKVRVFAAREIVLAGGAFNTPQLLMLSGIGPKQTLDTHAIPVRVALEGVGRNLQDRYEVAVVNRMNFEAWDALKGATFTREDEQYRQWARDRKGVYASNGVILSVVARSRPGAPSPDLFLYGLLGRFEGYFPGYSSLLAKNPNCLTWVVLKGHTNNTAGEVTLRSADPLVPPAINFRYFKESNDAREEDLKGVAAGVRLARQLAAPLKAEGLLKAEELPGADYDGDRLEEFIRDRAWGHHASCTCPIGDPRSGGVLTSDFKVHGVTGLRVVDASVFPRIPGFFIVSAVYMIGEKAADVIAKDAHSTAPLGPVTTFR